MSRSKGVHWIESVRLTRRLGRLYAGPISVSIIPASILGT
jgi:hypothetical protein